MKKRSQVEILRKFSEPPTGVEPMTFQIPVGRSNHWAMGVSWWARSYTRCLENSFSGVFRLENASSLFTLYPSHQSIYHLFTFIISTCWALQYGSSFSEYFDLRTLLHYLHFIQVTNPFISSIFIKVRSYVQETITNRSPSVGNGSLNV